MCDRRGTDRNASGLSCKKKVSLNERRKVGGVWGHQRHAVLSEALEENFQKD